VDSKLQHILALRVPVIVRLGERHLTVKDISELMPGAIIELPKHAEEELDLMVNNRRIGKGTAVKVGENFGIQISQIGDKAQRASAVTAKSQEDELDAASLAEQLLAGQL